MLHKNSYIFSYLSHFQRILLWIERVFIWLKEHINIHRTSFIARFTLFFHFALLISVKHLYTLQCLHKPNPISIFIYRPCFFEHSQQSQGSENTTLQSIIASPRPYAQLNNACHQNLIIKKEYRCTIKNLYIIHSICCFSSKN